MSQCETCKRDILKKCPVPYERTMAAVAGSCTGYRKGKLHFVDPSTMAMQDGGIPVVQRTHERKLIKRTYAIWDDQELWLKREAIHRYEATGVVESAAAIVREALDEKMAKEGQK